MKSFSSLVDLFRWCSSQNPELPALWFKREGFYRSLSWQEFSERVKAVALALDSLSVGRGDRIGILSENRPEWAFADLGTLSLGAVTVPIYPTSSVKECHYVLTHAETSILFVSNDGQFEKVLPLLKEGKLRVLIAFDRLDLREGEVHGVMDFRDFLERGRRSHLNNPKHYEERCRGISREDLATLIYTSGTTGPPKGVMLTHGNFLSNCEGGLEALPIQEKERSLSFLPLSHVFERMAGYYFMMLNGASIAYAESMQTVPENLLEVRPTVAAAVPRLYEKMYARILETVQAAPRGKQRLFHWAIKIGTRAGVFRSERRPLPVFLRLQFALAQRLVFDKIKKKLGGRIRFFISGGAPLAKELAEFFYSAGVLILEGYGLTETSPVISVNRLDRFKFGTVGLPLSNVEVKIASDGEILTRGPHVMKGYFKNPEATAEVLRDGWFYTGDLGEIDSGGFLKITGRKKDIIVTAGGKNISPQNIENEILSDPLFTQAVVLGDRKPYLVALLVLNRTEAEHLAQAEKLQRPAWEDLLGHEAFQAVVARRLAERTKDFASYEQIKYFHLLPRELSLDEGEVTPTLKVKRRVVMERYRNEIETLYRQGETRAQANVH
ncbi:MAG: long-chain fatty acid--CoA ligase [Candidatus Omnitrophica bacterium]|nr:long-chain fatty acid--CoA ligase [Candidatus Omnitrophota bacterium]